MQLLNLSKLQLSSRYIINHNVIRLCNFIGNFIDDLLSLQCDLLDLPAVAQLEKDAKYAPVYQLLKIFLTQRLNAYTEFQNANSGFLETYGSKR